MYRSLTNSQLSLFEEEKVKFKKNQYSPIVAESHSAPYKIHKYFARRPWNVFEQLVLSFSSENEIILDPFCGGGVTVYEGIRKNRKVIGCDINPLSIFVINGMVKNDISEKELFSIYQEVREYIKYLNGDFLKFSVNETSYIIDWCELTFKIKCSECNSETLLSNELKVKNGYFICINEKCKANSPSFSISSKDCERLGHQYLYLIGNNEGKKEVKKADNNDICNIINHLNFLKEEIKRENVTIPNDKIPLDWDRQFEDGLAKKGIENFQDLFTERNLYTLLLLLNKIKSFKEKVSLDTYELLRIAFSNTIKDTNIMAFTNETWQGGKPTTWSKHAYWVPSQFCEVSVLNAFDSGFQRVISSLNFNKTQNYSLKKASNYKEIDYSNLLLINNSVEFADIPDNSIDAIITDPPYGSNVQYLELSHFWYVWNKDMYDGSPNFKIEAISNRKKGFKGAKTMYDYENNLFKVFAKAYKCLKPNKFMVLTFNNKDVSAWLGLLFSIFKAGFTLSENGIYFQDGVKNYKQTAHTKAEGSPYGDFIYSFNKSEPTYQLKSYTSEDEFSEELETIFKKYLTPTNQDKNELIVDVFLSAIPIIESFSKTYLNTKSHSLYNKFNKNYLHQLYKDA